MFILHGRPSRGGRLMALGCTHTAPRQLPEKTSQSATRQLASALPSVAAITRPHLRLLLLRIGAWKTFEDCKRRCGTKTRICIHNMAEAAPRAGSTGEPPQYTALVDCRRRWEVRLGLGGGSLGPQIDPRRPEPACDRTIRAGGESRPVALLHPPLGLLLRRGHRVWLSCAH